MPDFLSVRFDQGENTSRDRAVLGEGELQQSVGAWYKPGDTERIWKQGGRQLAIDTTTAGRIQGIGLIQFDNNIDKLIAMSSGSIFAANPTSGSIASEIVSGLTTAADQTLALAHANDRWYVGNGYDRMRVLEADGSVRLAGMLAPVEQPIATASSLGATIARPTTETNGTDPFVNPANARDSSTSTFAHAARSSVGSSVCTWHGWGSDTAAGRSVVVRFALAKQTLETGPGGNRGFSVNIKIEIATDWNGTTGTFTNIVYGLNFTSTVPEIEVQKAVTANSNLLAVRVTLEYNSGTSVAELEVTDIRTQIAAVAAFDASPGFYYAIREYDANHGLVGPLGPISALVPLTSKNSVAVTLPTALQNSNTTNYQLFRTPNGGAAPLQLGLVKTVLAVAGAGQTVQDDFSLFDKDTQPLPLAPYYSITDPVSGGSVPFPRDLPPPSLRFVFQYKGRLMGLRRDSPRSLYASRPGLPESWPEFDQNDKFPLEEHDELQAGVQLGDSILIGAKGAIFVITEWPDVIGNTYTQAQVRPIQGQPGCVGPYALTKFSVAGENRAAWVSPFGVHSTNGVTAAKLTSDADWAAKVNRNQTSGFALKWDPDRQVLMLSYKTPTSLTENDAFALIHMAPEHQKANGLPKTTWDHPGKIVNWATGIVSNIARVWSGHENDGIIYLENSGGSDASNAYDSSGTWPFIVKTGRIYGSWKFYEFVTASLRHSDWGSGQTISITTEVGVDQDSASASDTETVPLAEGKGDEFFIGKAGEWMEQTYTHTGTGTGALLDCRVRANVGGSAGVVLATRT